MLQKLMSRTSTTSSYSCEKHFFVCSRASCFRPLNISAYIRATRAGEAASPDGVLFVGGSLAPDWMLEAYRRGIFPMPIKVDRRRLIAWLSPDPRGVLEFGALCISRRLARRLRRGEFSFTLDRAFAAV